MDDRPPIFAPDDRLLRLRSFQRSLPISLLRAREATMRKFKASIDRHDLTMQQWRVMRALADESGLDSKALAERCVIMPPSVTRISKALMARGLIRNIANSDGRRRCFELTDAGRALYADASVVSEGIYEEIETAFGTQNMTELLRLLDLLRRVTDALP